MKLKRGNVYRAKRPRQVGIPPVFNDRRIISILSGHITYDSPLLDGVNHHVTSLEDFVHWAASDVTDQVPQGGWEPWEGDE